jgi:hypothetical protein
MEDSFQVRVPFESAPGGLPIGPEIGLGVVHGFRIRIPPSGNDAVSDFLQPIEPSCPRRRASSRLSPNSRDSETYFLLQIAILWSLIFPNVFT